MSQLYQFEDHMMLLADYGSPAEHAHLASHLILSLSGRMEWTVEGEHFDCQGICIGPDVRHSGIVDGGSLIFLFAPISHYARFLHEHTLKERPCAVLDDAIVEQSRKAFERAQEHPETADGKILQLCGLDRAKARPYDERIQAILDRIETMETIPPDAVSALSGQQFLSSSRISHLFHEQTGMTLHSYLAFEKLRKTYRYIRGGKSITESSLLAGFDSSSHCAATCRRMFGISIREVQRTIAGK